MDDALLAEIVLVVHFCYAGFVVLGFLAVGIGRPLGWRWVRNRTFRWLHVAAIALVGAEALLGIVCPLTEWEYRLRRGAGLAADHGTFIGRLVSRLLYYDFPPWVFTTAYLALTALALALLWMVPPRRRAGRGKEGP